NLPEYGDGARVYTQKVLPSRVGLPQVAANQAICEVLESGPRRPAPRAFVVRRTDSSREVYGTTALSVGRMSVSSVLTLEAQAFTFAVLRFTSHDVHCVVSATISETQYDEVKTELLRLFARRSLSEVVRGLDRSFGET